MKNSVDIKFTRDRAIHKAQQFYSQKGWYKEYLKSGAQYRMTFLEFKSIKRKQLKKKG